MKHTRPSTPVLLTLLCGCCLLAGCVEQSRTRTRIGTGVESAGSATMPVRLAPLPAGRWITISNGPVAEPSPEPLGDRVPAMVPR